MSFCVERGISHTEWLSWSAPDRAKTIAFLMESADTCNLCGTADWQWAEDQHAFAPSEHWCRGCYLKSIASEDAGKMPGTTVNLVPATAKFLAEMEDREKRRARMRAET